MYKNQQMEEHYLSDKSFTKNDTVQKGEYEKCNFNSIDFTDKDLSEFIFTDCTFNGCNLSMVSIHKTVFRDVAFRDCKMLGLRFDTCQEFGLSFSFDGCQLDHSSFYQRKIRKTAFRNSQIREVDFTEADLSGVLLENCDLLNAHFERTILEKADLSTAYNFSIDPEGNRIRKAKFSVSGLAGLLGKYDIEIEG